MKEGGEKSCHCFVVGDVAGAGERADSLAAAAAAAAARDGLEGRTACRLSVASISFCIERCAATGSPLAASMPDDASMAAACSEPLECRPSLLARIGPARCVGPAPLGSLSRPLSWLVPSLIRSSRRATSAASAEPSSRRNEDEQRPRKASAGSM